MLQKVLDFCYGNLHCKSTIVVSKGTLYCLQKFVYFHGIKCILTNRETFPTKSTNDIARKVSNRQQLVAPSLHFHSYLG